MARFVAPLFQRVRPAPERRRPGLALSLGEPCAALPQPRAELRPGTLPGGAVDHRPTPRSVQTCSAPCPWYPRSPSVNVGEVKMAGAKWRGRPCALMPGLRESCSGGSPQAAAAPSLPTSHERQAPGGFAQPQASPRPALLLWPGAGSPGSWQPAWPHCAFPLLPARAARWDLCLAQLVHSRGCHCASPVFWLTRVFVTLVFYTCRHPTCLIVNTAASTC